MNQSSNSVLINVSKFSESMPNTAVVYMCSIYKTNIQNSCLEMLKIHGKKITFIGKIG